MKRIYSASKILFENKNNIRVIKHKLNEAFASSALKNFFKEVQNICKEQNKFAIIYWIANGNSFETHYVSVDGELTTKRGVPLSDITDNDIYGGKVYVGDELKNIIKGTVDNPNPDITIKTLCDKTKGNYFSCFVASFYNDYGKVFAGIFIKEQGAKSIMNMINKHNERKNANKSEFNWNEDKSSNEYKQKSQRVLFNDIKNAYNNYKNTYGDKMALKMSQTINKLMKNPDFVNFMKQNEYYEYNDEPVNIKKFLYKYLLYSKEERKKMIHFGSIIAKYEKMDNTPNFQKLYSQFHPDNTNDNW